MILTKLILAHLIGDFFLQPERWVKDKEEKGWRSGWLYLHVGIHFALILILLWDLSFWREALLIAGSHLVIDLVKLASQTERSRAGWFYADQALHLAVLAGVWIYVTGGIAIDQPSSSSWMIGAGLLFLTLPVSSLMQHFMGRWNHQIAADETDSLQGAGQYIGILERIFIYISILTGHIQIIGFLLGAKSIFRFGDLTRAKDRRLTEYILVGTLLSFLIAIGTGLLVARLA